jgi:SAM-dependent methyltransferase
MHTSAPQSCTVLAPAQAAELKAKLKTTWMAGDYDLFSRYMESGAETFFRRLDLPPRTHLLDVACGSGQLALIAARAGLSVCGCDIATNWLERARQRAAAERLPIEFSEGDAESLPFLTASFDAVVSVFGAMFAPHPEAVACELARVCRHGGMVAMANWTPSGFIGQMFKAIARHIAPPGMPSPVLWGDEDIVRARLGPHLANLRLTPRLYRFDYPWPPDQVVDFFRANYGPTSKAFAALDPHAQRELHADLTRLWSCHNQAGPNSTRIDAEYLEVVGFKK